jgi:hypothetical protein
MCTAQDAVERLPFRFHEMGTPNDHKKELLDPTRNSDLKDLDMGVKSYDVVTPKMDVMAPYLILIGGQG